MEKAVMATLLSVTSMRPRRPSPDEFDQWLAFAREHAPFIHPHQSDVSRITSSCIWWAHQRGVCYQNVTICKNSRNLLTFASVQPSQLKKVNATPFLDLVRENFEWMDKVCRILFTLRSVYLRKVCLEKRHGHLVKLLETMAADETAFDTGAAMDMMIDFDTFRDVVDALRNALEEIRTHFGSGTGM